VYYTKQFACILIQFAKTLTSSHQLKITEKKLRTVCLAMLLYSTV